MNGKIVGIVLLLCGALAGGGLYYLQIYGFYDDIGADAAGGVSVLTDDGPRALAISNFRAIDADSSPIRFRACFDTDPQAVPEGLVPATDAVPRNAPGWFDCFDAKALADELAAGTATAFVGVKNIHYGVDRIVAITRDGRGYVWHDLNACGNKAYDGTVIGEECPPRPEEAT